MTDRYATLFESGVNRYDSAEDAWEVIKSDREQVEWDPEMVRTDSPSGTELKFQTVASDD